MNIRDYIESGIIESCILGLATEAEQEEFASLLIRFPEVAEASIAFENALKAKLTKDAVRPPLLLKEEILRLFYVEEAARATEDEEEYKVPSKRSNSNVWKLVSTMSFLVLIISIFFGYSMFDKYQKLKKATEISQSNKLPLPTVNPILALTSVISKPSIKWSMMVAPDNSSHCMAHVYWDTVTKDTYLLVGNIPRPVANKKFQLWAVFSHHPINLGVFDVHREGQIIQMKQVDKVQSFFITIEPKGGSNTATIEDTYAVANL